jgi:hypothetical protein
VNWRFEAATGHGRRHLLVVGAAAGVLIVGSGLIVSLTTGHPSTPKRDAARTGVPAGVEGNHPFTPCLFASFELDAGRASHDGPYR